MDKDYKGVVVANELGTGILFAKRTCSKFQTMSILGSEILRLVNDYDGEVIITNSKDGYGEPLIVAKFKFGESKYGTIEYKVLFCEE